jgi:hypothetical protein
MSDRPGDPPYTGDERTTLCGRLDHQRAILERKCAGLDPDALRSASAPPSPLTLLGLVAHLTEVERSWFGGVIEGGTDPPRMWDPGGDEGFDVAGADPAPVLATWRAECERSRAVVARAPSLEVTGLDDGQAFALRYVLVHLIEEYARHNGHADLIRESIDGQTGE